MPTVDPERSLWPSLYRMLVWLSPGFPVGSFSFSHGLEAAAENGMVRDRETLQDWIGAILTWGSGRIDIDILRDAHRATLTNDLTALAQANERGLVFRASAEMALETKAQGTAFLNTCLAAWPDRFLDHWAATHGESGVCYPAAVGAATARAGISLDWAFIGYLQALAANLVSAGLRLGIIGQTDGQRILATLEPVIAEAAASGLSRGPDAFGGSTFAVELASMGHETQYTRLFQS